MRLTVNEVKHIALLARVAMTDEEVEKMRDELSNILDQFQVIQHVDTEDVEPTGHSANLESVMRDDKPADSTPKEDILANVPSREGDFLRVRAVLE